MFLQSLFSRRWMFIRYFWVLIQTGAHFSHQKFPRVHCNRPALRFGAFRFPFAARAILAFVYSYVRLFVLLREAFALSFVPSRAIVPIETIPSSTHSFTTWTNNSLRIFTLSLRNLLIGPDVLQVKNRELTEVKEMSDPDYILWMTRTCLLSWKVSYRIAGFMPFWDSLAIPL